MSDGIIRLCNEHDMELRQLGAHLVCPHGHTCDVEWYLKPHAIKSGPSLAAPVVEITTADPAQPRKAKHGDTMPETTKTNNRVVHPHGTPQRYFQEVKIGETCEACRKAANAYAKAKRAERTKSKAPAKTASRVRTPVRTMTPARTTPNIKAAAGDLEGRILRLRAELAEAEAAYIAHVQILIPGIDLAR